MSQYERIFLIADPEMQRTPAFERAAVLARSTGADLHIVIFDHDPVIAGMALFDKDSSQLARKAWMDRRRAWLLEQSALIGVGHSKVSVDVVWARAVADEILLQIADWSPDIVVKDVHLEGLLKRVLLKPLDWQLLRQCPAPLLLVNSVAHAKPQRVVAAVDVSHGPFGEGDLNDAVIRAALALAIQCDAKLHLIYAFWSPVVAQDPMGMGVMGYDDFYAQLRQDHQRNFDALAKAHSVPHDRAHFLMGPPATTVADFARNNHSDVVVIGAARHTVMDRLLMGTTAEDLLDRIPCNVLAVKPESHPALRLK